MQTEISAATLGAFSTEQITAQLRASAARFASLVAHIADPSATCPHLPDWRANEIVRHVTVLPAYYADIANGDADLIAHAPAMGDKNIENMRLVADLSLAECAAAMVDGIDAFCTQVEATPEREIDFQAGARPRLIEMGGMAIGEYEIHGLDLAAAIGRPWQVDSDAAAMTIMAALPGAGAQWVDPVAAAGHSGRYRVTLRGGRGQVHVAFDNGAVAIHGSPDPKAAQPASTLISADPVAMLSVFYRRRSQWGAVAKGQIVSYGTRPIRALTLKNKFLPI